MQRNTEVGLFAGPSIRPSIKVDGFAKSHRIDSKAKSARCKALLKAQAANLRLTTPKAFTLTLGTLAHFRHFLLLMTKDETQHRSWTFYEAVRIVEKKEDT